MRDIFLYIGGVGNLKERTNYFKKVAGEVDNFERDGGWIDVTETVDGGAVVIPAMNLAEFLDCVFARSIERAADQGRFNLVVDETTGSVVFMMLDGKPMSFDKVMRFLFD